MSEYENAPPLKVLAAFNLRRKLLPPTPVRRSFILRSFLYIFKRSYIFTHIFTFFTFHKHMNLNEAGASQACQTLHPFLQSVIKSVSEWVIVSDSEKAIASIELASLLHQQAHCTGFN